ncbi:MAG: hypothetical protein MJ071_08375 [Oscillospiraceae bacterium]|nr:hypothetical protein [Oscillospiraceae bacterium]
MKRCNRCLNDQTVRRIRLDEEGICAYCRNYDAILPQLQDSSHLRQLFLERIEHIRGKFDYDAAVGISGGKDSMYVLYHLIHTYHLKVKAFTMLNGFFSDTARKNVDRIVAEFGIEHEYISFDENLRQRFFRFSMEHWLVPCVACSYLGYAAMINYTMKINAGMCIHGRSPQQMFRYYGDDVFTPFVDAGLQHPEQVEWDALYQKLLGLTESKLNAQLAEDVREMLYQGTEGRQFREFSAYFLYHPYDEQEIVRFLREHTAWQPEKDYDHYDCRIHHAAHYIYQCAEGRPHCLPEISVLVRSGQCTREEGQRLIEKAVYDSAPKKELDELCHSLSVRPFAVFSKAWVYKHFVKK